MSWYLISRALIYSIVVNEIEIDAERNGQLVTFIPNCNRVEWDSLANGARHFQWVPKLPFPIWRRSCAGNEVVVQLRVFRNEGRMMRSVAPPKGRGKEMGMVLPSLDVSAFVIVMTSLECCQLATFLPVKQHYLSQSCSTILPSLSYSLLLYLSST